MQSYNGQFLRRKEMEVLGVTCRGDDVPIHVSVVIINPAGVQIGNGVRIDPFCLLSAGGGIRLGDHIHIGGAGIALPADGASAAKKWNCALNRGKTSRVPTNKAKLGVTGITALIFRGSARPE